MKKYTIDQVAEWIKNAGNALDSDVNEYDYSKTSFYYYLHVKDGELVSSIDGADYTARVNARYLDSMFEDSEETDPEGFWGAVSSTETLENEGFRDVCQELTNDINAYIEDDEE